MIQMCQNSSLIIKTNLNKIHHVYRGPMRSSHILFEDGFLFLKERLSTQGNYLKLQIVPRDIKNIIFIAYHANPIRGHLATYQTSTKIRLRYYWPYMYKYIAKMISMCAGCCLGNPLIRHSRELIYSFPVDKPFKVIHADVFTIGADLGFSGHKIFMVIVCGLCTFAIQEPLREMNSTSFADAIMKITLAYGLAHTTIAD